LAHRTASNVRARPELDALTTADRGLLERQIKLIGIACSIESLEVPVLPLAAILAQHQIAKPEIVVIDTEGMEPHRVGSGGVA